MTAWPAADKPHVVLPQGGGNRLTVFGNPFWVKVSGEATTGAVALLVATFRPGSGALPHLHRGHDECFYVLSGTFRFRVGDDYAESGEGGFCFAPRNAAHGFENIGDTPGSMLGVIAPAGYERHFMEISELPPGKDTAEELAEIFSRYDQEPA